MATTNTATTYTTTNTIKEVFTMKTIGKHTMHAFNRPAIISTVQLSADEFETMVMFDDGDELECIRTATLADAKRTHNEVMRRWNDRLYEGSVAKAIGFANIGQFVHTVKAC